MHPQQHCLRRTAAAAWRNPAPRFRLASPCRPRVTAPSAARPHSTSGHQSLAYVKTVASQQIKRIHSDVAEDTGYASSEMSRNPIVSSSLISIENATPSIKRFTFRVDGVPAKQEFKFRPGQWVELSLPSLPSLGKTRFSISCSPDGNATQQQRAFSVTVKDAYQNPIVKYLHDPARRVGDGSLFHAQVGGAFWYREASPDGAGDNANAVQKVLLIAGGVGIAPLMSMLEYVVQGSVGGVLNGAQYPSRKRTHVTLLYSVQDEMELLYVDRLRDLATTFHPGSTGLRLVLDIQLYVTRYAIRKPDSNQEDLVVQSQTNNPLKFYYGCYITPRLLSDYLSSSDADMDSTTIYMCGPESLERSVYSHLQKLEFPIERSLHFERWWK